MQGLLASFCLLCLVVYSLAFVVPPPQQAHSSVKHNPGLKHNHAKLLERHPHYANVLKQRAADDRKYKGGLLINLKLGSPPQKFQLNLDLFSPVGYIFGDKLVETNPEANLIFYNESASSTNSIIQDSVDDNSDFKYHAANDTLYLSTHSKFANVPFFVIDKFYDDAPEWNGIIGMHSLVDFADAPYGTIWDTISPNLKDSIYTVTYENDINQVAALTVGEVDTTLCNKGYSWGDFPFLTYDYTFPPADVLVNGTSIDYDYSTVIDIYTDLPVFYTNTKVRYAIVKLVSGVYDPDSQFYKVNCSAQNTDKTIEIVIGYQIDNVQTLIIPIKRLIQENNGECLLMVYSSSEIYWALGDYIFRDNCVAINYKLSQIGFSQKLPYPKGEKKLCKNHLL